MGAVWAVAGLFSKRLADGLARAGWSVLLAAFGIRVTVRGRPEPGALFVANHVSWADIAILARLTSASFVAKDTVRGWPVLGWLARRHGCVFVDRGQPLGVGRQVADLAGGLRRAGGLVLFPEATTSDGLSVLPFRSSLFSAVAAMDNPVVQPVALVFRAPDGGALDAGARRAVAWLDDDALLPHALALAARDGVLAEIWFEAPVPPADRKAMARACREAIRARLAAADQAGTLNLAA